MASKSAYEDYSVVANSYDKYRVAFGIEIILGALGKYSERNPVSSLSILEAGCGTGNFTLEMCRYVAHVTAVDGSDDMLAVAESKLKGVKNVSFKECGSEEGTLFRVKSVRRCSPYLRDTPSR